MDFLNFIFEQALILIPALYIVGCFLKTSSLDDKFIPLVLLVIGIGLAISLMGFNVNAVIQGILVAGAAVFTDQMSKQLKK